MLTHQPTQTSQVNIEQSKTHVNLTLSSNTITSCTLLLLIINSKGLQGDELVERKEGCIGVMKLYSQNVTAVYSRNAFTNKTTIIAPKTKIDHNFRPGQYIIAAESGTVIYWRISDESVIFREEQKDILQVQVMVVGDHSSFDLL